jgi:hypothetical protein
MNIAKSQQNSTWSAEHNRIEKLLNICRGHCYIPHPGFWLGMTVVTLGIGFLVLGIAFLIGRLSKLTAAEVREVLAHLSTAEERSLGSALFSKRGGVVYTGDLIPLIRHLEAQSKQLMQQECAQKLNPALAVA